MYDVVYDQLSLMMDLRTGILNSSVGVCPSSPLTDKRLTEGNHVLAVAQVTRKDVGSRSPIDVKTFTNIVNVLFWSSMMNPLRKICFDFNGGEHFALADDVAINDQPWGSHNPCVGNRFKVGYILQGCMDVLACYCNLNIGE